MKPEDFVSLISNLKHNKQFDSNQSKAMDDFTNITNIIIMTIFGFLLGCLFVLNNYRKEFMLAIESYKKEAILLNFPDKKLPCFSFYNYLKGKNNANCIKGQICDYHHYKPPSKFERDHPEWRNYHQSKNGPELSSLMKIFLALSEAKSSIDLCMFVFTFGELADYLIHLSKEKGIKIRVITDVRQSVEDKTQIPKLEEAGIDIKTNNQGSSMHNKFVIIDNKTLLHGSFNWTYSAVIKNQEHCLIDNRPELVKEFKKHFDSLWPGFNTFTRQQQWREDIVLHSSYQPFDPVHWIKEKISSNPLLRWFG